MLAQFTSQAKITLNKQFSTTVTMFLHQYDCSAQNCLPITYNTRHTILFLILCNKYTRYHYIFH